MINSRFTRSGQIRIASTRGFQEIYGSEPSIRLADGLERTYRWIYDQLASRQLQTTH